MIELARRCVGAHCAWRGRCKHHALPTTDTKSLIWPTKVEDACDWYEAKSETKPWGNGGDSND